MTVSVPVTSGGFLPASFDNATKLLSFSKPNVAGGAVTYGQATIGLRTAYSFLPEFEAGLPGERLAVEDFANRLSAFFMQQWQMAMPMPPAYVHDPMVFVVGGFDADAAYGRVFVFAVPYEPAPREQNPGDGQFGITWGGQREVVDRLIRGYDAAVLDVVQQRLGFDAATRDQLVQALRPFQMSIRLEAMPLQDCVDLAIFFIRTTIEGQRLTVGLRGVGGPIDVAVITRREG